MSTTLVVLPSLPRIQLFARALLPARIATQLVLGVCAARLPCAKAAPLGPVGYTFELRPGPPRTIGITLRVHGGPEGVSRLAVAPSWGGVEHCERFIHGLAVRDSAGQICKMKVDPAALNVWVISHKPGELLTASYELRQALPDPLVDAKTHYEPVVRDDLLHLIGETGLIYPQWLDDRGPVDIDVTWSGLRERGWTTATSFDAEGGRIHRSLPAFRHAMFFAGRLRVYDRGIKGGTLRVAIYGDAWDFQDHEFVNLVERIVVAERTILDDYSDPYFLVTVVPMGPRSTPQSFSFAGTGLTNCFALFLPPGTAVVQGSRHRGQILHLLAHEYFHTWNGGKMLMEEPEQLVYWFSEGFTDFYASRFLRSAGLIDDAEWANRLNDTLKSLWLSPVSTEPAETIRREFWSRQEVNELPYHRGEIVALALDEEIRRGSGGARTLDDFMRDRLAAARRGEKSETGRLLAGIAHATNLEFADSLRRVVVSGALPSLPSHLTEPAATREDVDGHRYDAGFDVDATLKSKVVSGVRGGSAAQKAGLSDGQAVEGLSIYRGDANREIDLTVRDHNQRRSIRFFPRGPAISIPSYRLDRSTHPYPLFGTQPKGKNPVQ